MNKTVKIARKRQDSIAKGIEDVYDGKSSDAQTSINKLSISKFSAHAAHGPRAQVVANQKNLVSVIENINDTFGIKGKVRVEGFDTDSNAQMGGKDQLDQGGKEGNILYNEDISKCERRQHFMERN